MHIKMDAAKRQRLAVDHVAGAIGDSFLTIENFEDGETVHQRCVIIKGRCTADANVSDVDNGFMNVDDDFVTVESSDGLNTNFPLQTWPVVNNRVKIIALLSPGVNKLSIKRSIDKNVDSVAHQLTLNYMPLLQTPALHLAIMVAKDSPLVIDCPPVKYGPMSSAHSSMEAAIAKLRMSAYMWQALTAEDMRMKGLGRRAFRLEEEFTADTTSRAFLADGLHASALESSGAMRSSAKVHIIRSDKTVAELRDMDIAQQNEKGKNRDKLFDHFLDALARHGAPFESSTRPVVAGMILDSHYCMDRKVILAHAALGCHNPKSVSLGMMGSHLTYSWPRFLEEVSESLLDTRPPGTTVGNDNNECDSLWEACCVGQGAFLHEVGHAFGAPHTTGIMARGYSRHWPRNFLVKTAYAQNTKQQGVVVVDGETENDARWDLKDALSFRQQRHFWLPGDVRLEAAARSAIPTAKLVNIGSDDLGIEVSCAAGLVSIEFDGKSEAQPTVASPIDRVFWSAKELEARFSQDEALTLSLVGMNGKSNVVRNVWKLLAASSEFVRIPGSSVILRKTSVKSGDLEGESGEEDGNKYWEWATLLSRKTKNGTIEHASSVDVRTGCILDGAYVYFPSGARINCGPRVRTWGGKHEFGGHAAQDVSIPKGGTISKITVARESYILDGMRIHFDDGTAGGALSGNYYGDDDEDEDEDERYDDESAEKLELEPQPDERIVGFYGRSWWGQHFDGLVEFGIITAPKDVELPESVYSIKELQNTDGGRSAEELEGKDLGDD